MKRTIAVGLALAVALLGQVAPSMAQDYGRDGRDYNRGDRDYGQNNQDNNQGRWGNRYGQIGLDDLEGRWIARRGYDLPSGNRYGSSVMNAGLPPRMVIDQRRNVIRVENFRGRVLQQIVIGDQRSGYSRGGYVYGQWRDGKLLTVRSGDYNTRIVQTFALSNRGRTLMVTTRQDGPGTRHDVEFTNVYQRA